VNPRNLNNAGPSWTNPTSNTASLRRRTDVIGTRLWPRARWRMDRPRAKVRQSNPLSLRPDRRRSDAIWPKLSPITVKNSLHSFRLRRLPLPFARPIWNGGATGRSQTSITSLWRRVRIGRLISGKLSAATANLWPYSFFFTATATTTAMLSTRLHLRLITSWPGKFITGGRLSPFDRPFFPHLKKGKTKAGVH